MVHLIKQKHIESVVIAKFGYESLRIFRLLLLKNSLEENQIAKLSMLSITDVRERLVQMLHEDCVRVQEISKNAKEFKSAQVFYYWTVNWGNVLQLFIDQVYHAMHNLMVRLRYELDSNATLLQKQEEEKQQQLLGGMDMLETLFTKQEKEKLEKVMELQERMHDALVQLDTTLFILTDDTDKER
eukprot:TRINITY_DN9490_c0_g1_i1.p1 TRINITY_DN9490_c0_g1~~TRINITY_DN9490_c0_g1_i1.p1  ORF type:complete len:185 (+),score=57.56 TRINITY_DN9490_c0_g1_i1:321-875(+)